MLEQPVMNTNLKAPFPYFGGKGMIADRIWSYLGDCKQYIEPFAGSAAVLLKRPPTKHAKIYEIINDLDGMICNVWRAISADPDEVASYCDYAADHIDLIARKATLIASYNDLCEKLKSDDAYYDSKLAGYYVWCTSVWIGSGLMCPNQRPHLTGDMGITSQRPHLTGDKPKTIKEILNGMELKDCGTTLFYAIQQDRIRTANPYLWMAALQARLRGVKKICGDWSRVCGGNWQDDNSPVGIFFDPPYATDRDKNIYFHDDMIIAKDVEKWVLERGKNKNYRIVVCGYDDEYTTLLENGWRFEAWSAGGSYSRRHTRGAINRHRERLFISPYCENAKQKELFDTARIT